VAKKFLTIITLIIILVACGNRETDTVCEYTIMAARDAMNRVWQELTIPQGQAGAFDIDATIVQVYSDEPFIMTTEVNLQMITDGFRTERLLTYEVLRAEFGILQLYTIEEGNNIISYLFFVDGIETYYDENYARVGIEGLWDILFSNVPNMPIERLRSSAIEIMENGNTVIDVFIHAQEEVGYAPYLGNLVISYYRNTIILDSNGNPQGVAREWRLTDYSTTRITLTFNAFGEDVEIHLP
jgi:hypothetical protein